MLDEIASARARAKVELPQLSRHARAAWRNLEGRLVSIEGTLQEEGGTLTENVVASIRELTRSAHDILRHEETPLATLTHPVDSVMTTELVTCSPTDALSRAAQIMWDHDTGIVPVVDDAGKVVGLVTDRDACMGAHMRGEALHHVPVDSAMSKRVHVCRPHEMIARALELMRKHQLRRLPVVGDGSHLRGLVSLADIARRVDPKSPAGAEVVRTLAAVSERVTARAGE